MEQQKKILNLEFWADSFHEGFWACEEFAKFYTLVDLRYENGFIPVFLFEITPLVHLKITVYGSYKNWTPLPEKIAYLIDWGKPDLIAYDPEKKEIIFAVEETAAVPTGNQALQRCERMYGSLRLGIPFWYLLGEYGVHIDGGIRRDSIWPTILGIKLSCSMKTPCIVLHYSDIEHPEDYTFGTGVHSLYEALTSQIEIHFGLKAKGSNVGVLTEHYKHMLSFVENQWDRIVNYIPQKDLLDKPDTAEKIANLVGSGKDLGNELLDFFNWGKTDDLPENIYRDIKPGGMIKADAFIVEVEKIVKQKRAYNLSGNAGSRPQNRTELSLWIDQQRSMFSRNTVKDARFEMSLGSFPQSISGRFHVTTAKNVFYLIDSLVYLDIALKRTFPRLSNLNLKLENEIPIFLYVCNSVKPGRIFGDPYTGQLSAFSNIFTRNVAGDKTRISFAYYPHQVHTQLFDDSMQFRKNKGIVMMRELLDYAIFHGGVIVDMKSGELL